MARILAMCLVLLALPATLRADWKAGTAKVAITPSQYQWMAGYGARNRPADGLLTDLYAKALAIEEVGGQKIVMVSLDLVGIDRDTARLICEAAAEKYGLQRRQIALCTSHTHSGPVAGRTLAPMYFLNDEQWAQVRAYTMELRGKIVGVIGEALGSMEPANVSWGNGRCGFAVNRRTNHKDVLSGAMPDERVFADKAAGKLKGPVDHDVPVLAVRSPEDRLRAVAFGYACHATVLSGYEWCGDYPGFAMAELEMKNPGAVALFFAGCGADQNPLPRRKVEYATRYGAELAQSVGAVLGGVMKPVDAGLSAHYTEIKLPLGKLPSRQDLETESQSVNKYNVARAKMLLRQLDAGKELAGDYPYPIQVWKLGAELKWILLGGEVVVDYSLRLKKELGGKTTWVAGYTNDVMAYIPSLRVLKEGGYEGGGAMVYYGLPTIWGENSEETLIRGVHETAK